MERIRLKHVLIAFAVIATVIILGIAISQLTKSKRSEFMLSDEFIESVSAKTLEEMKKDLQNSTSNNILKELVASEVFSEEFNKVLADTVGEEYIQEISDRVLEHITDKVIEQSNNDLSQFIEKQEVAEEITKIITNEIGDKDIHNVNAKDLEKVKNSIYEKIKSTLNEYITNSSSDYSYELSEEDLMKIINSVKSENSSKDETKQTVSKGVITSLKSTLKSPLISVDPLGGTEAENIGNQAATTAGTEAFKQLTDLTNKIESIKSNSAELTTKVNALESLVKKQDLSHIQSNITNITTSIKEINTIANDLASKIDIRNKSLFKIKGDKVVKLNTSKMTIAEFVGVLSSNQDAYTEMLDKLESYIEKVDVTSSSNYVQLATGIADLEAGLTLSNSSIADLTTSLSKEVEERMQSIANLRQTIKNDINVVNTTFNDYKSYVDSTYSTKDELKKSEKDLENALTDMSTNLTNKYDTLDQKSQDTASNINNRIDSVLGTLSGGEIGSTIDTLEEGVADINSNVQDLQTDLSDLTLSFNNEVQNRVDAMNVLRENLSTDISDVSNSLTNYKNYVESTYAKPVEIAAAKTELTNSLNTLSNTVSGNKALFDELNTYTHYQVENITTSIDNIHNTLDSHAADISNINADVITLFSSVSSLTSGLGSCTDSITKEIADRIKGDKDLLEKFQKELKDKIDLVNSSMATDRQAAQNAVNELAAVVSGNKVLFDALDSYTQQKVTALTQAVTDEEAARKEADDVLKGLINTANAALENYKEIVENTYAKPSDINAAKVILEGHLSDLQTQINAVADPNSGSIANLNTAINDFKSEVANTYATQTTVTNLQNSLNTVAADVDTNKINISNLNTSVTNLQTTTSTSQTNISSLNTSVSNLQSKDAWVTGITLRNTSGTSSGKNVYRTVDGSGNWVYNVYGSNIGATLTATSDITIQYNASTPDIVASYSQSDGLLQIIIDKNYVSLITGNITIDSMHIENN